MRWTIQIPILVYTREGDEGLEPAELCSAPMEVRMAIAEAMWQLGAGLSKTTAALTVGAEIEVDPDLRGTSDGNR